MNSLLKLTGRNIKLYLRNKVTVFFSMFSVLIMLVLYLTFIGKNISDEITKVFSSASSADIRTFTTWMIIGGLLVINCINLPLSMIGQMAEDRATGSLRDFYVSPINRNLLIISYILSSTIVTMVFNTVIIIAGQVFVVANGGDMLSILTLLKAVGIALLITFTMSAFIFFIMTFIKSRDQVGIMGTTFGTLSGFLAGVYVPFSVLPSGIRAVCSALPFAQGGKLLKDSLMNDIVAKLTSKVPVEAADAIKDVSGLRLMIGSFEVNTLYAFIFVGSFFGLFAILSIFRVKKQKDI